MFNHSGIIAVFAAALILAEGSIFANDNKSAQQTTDEVRVTARDKMSAAGAIKGMLIGEKGKPFGGAEIQAQRVDTKAKAVVAVTKPDGHYFFIGLPVGTYSLTAYVDGTAMSRANVRTRNEGWVKVDFDLRLNAKGADGTDQMQRDVRFGDGSIHPRDNALQRGF